MEQKHKVKRAQKHAAKDKKPSKKYRYVMEVMEEVVSTTAIDSDVPLDDEQLHDIAEQRRCDAKLSFKEVRDVDISCCAVYVTERRSKCHERRSQIRAEIQGRLN